MFWKRRNIIALVLILVCALSVPQGYRMLTDSDMHPQETRAADQNTTYPITEPTGDSHREPSTATTSPVPEDPVTETRRTRFFGATLILVGLLAGFAGVLLPVPREPLLGPDLAAVLFGLCFVYLRAQAFPETLPLGCLLLSARELWGWLWSRFSLDWCLCHRLGNRARWYPLLLFLWALVLLGLLAFFAILFGELLHNYTCVRFQDLAYTFVAGIILPYLLSAVVRIHSQDAGRHLILLPFVVAFLSDTGAYFAGCFLGSLMVSTPSLYLASIPSTSIADTSKLRL